MANFFTVPDKEKNYQSYMVYALAIIWAVITGVIVLSGLYFLPHAWLRWLTFFGISLFIAVFNLGLNYFGYTRVASWSFTIMLWLYITIPCYSAGGIVAPGIITQMSVILTAGFLLGWRGGLAIGLLTMGVDFWMVYLEITGRLPAPSVIHNPITRWVGAIIPFGSILALQYYATNHLRTGLIALQREIIRREEAEKIKNKTVYDLGERVKEMKTLYAVSRLLQVEDTPVEELFTSIAEVLPPGWQYPAITSARISIGDATYATQNYRPSEYYQQAEMKTTKATRISIEIAYATKMPELDEGPFLKEERYLITALVEMLIIDLERKERRAELKDYKYALDLSYIISISTVEGLFIFVNDNFCKISKYSQEELLGQDHNILWSGVHPPEYFLELATAMQDGKPYRGEFCNRAKDGSLYWVETTIVPFLDETGTIYQYLSINHNITKRKEAEEQIIQSEKLLRKITSQIPGNTYMFKINENGRADVLFMNRGTDTFNHGYSLEEVIDRPGTLRETVHDEDTAKFNDAMKEGYQTQRPISVQYRMIVNEQIRWRWMQAVPEKEENGEVTWYGATSDITPLVDYIASIEQIIFDIGHVIRRPISTMMGMTRLINDTHLNEQELKDISRKLYLISDEMDKFIRGLNDAYSQKRQETKGNIDVSPLIDKRDSLFR